MRIRSVLSHAAQAALEGVLIATLVVGLMAGTTFAAKPAAGSGGHHGGGTTSGATIVVPAGVFAQTDNATVTPAGLWVYASCSQGGKQVYAQYVLSNSTGVATLTLGPTSFWSSGSASCYANAGSFSVTGQWSTAATTTFSVSGS